jgi:AraC-type DNA-binding domain-containing proteins
MGSVLEVFSDLSERLNYNLPDFPLYVRKGALIQFDRYAAACHWHSDLEFILVLDGSLEYFINGKTVHIDKGNGIFVNSKRLHYGFSADKSDCIFIVVAVHPSLLGESTHAGKLYLEVKFGSKTDDFILLTAQNPWQQEALLTIKKMYAEMYCSAYNPLRLLSQAASLCACIGDHVQQVSGNHTEDQLWLTVRNMIGFIHQNYDIKITLDDIAAAGTVCRSRCCELFGTFAGQTPNTFLIRYRIQKSCEMLRETNRSICEIGVACGFQSASYFSYVFRNEMGMIPQDYRKQSSASVSSNS